MRHILCVYNSHLVLISLNRNCRLQKGTARKKHILMFGKNGERARYQVLFSAYPNHCFEKFRQNNKIQIGEIQYYHILTSFSGISNNHGSFHAFRHVVLVCIIFVSSEIAKLFCINDFNFHFSHQLLPKVLKFQQYVQYHIEMSTYYSGEINNNIRLLRIEKITNNDVFQSHIAVSLKVCTNIWALIGKSNMFAIGYETKFMLWTLMFLKTYSIENTLMSYFNTTKNHFSNGVSIL